MVESTVFDGVDSGVQRVFYACESLCVGCRAFVGLVRLLDPGAQLSLGKGFRARPYPLRQDAPGRHKLQDLRARFQFGSRRRAHRVRAIGLGPQKVPVPTCHGDVAP